MNKLKNLVLLGAPGSGKGTQSELIKSSFNYSHLSTGNLLRSEIESNSHLGLKVKTILSAGGLVPDDLMFDLISKNVKDKNNLIFDGFPRTLIQAQFLNDFLGEDNYLVFYFKIDYSFLIKRLVNRRICLNCDKVYNILLKPPHKLGKCDTCHHDLIQRDDDKESIVTLRIETFKENFEPLLDFYREKSFYSSVDASLDTATIFKTLKAKIEEY